MIKWAVLATLLVFVAYFAYLSWSTRHGEIGDASERNIRPCQNKPNCVSSVDSRERHRIEPLPRKDGATPADDWQRLIRAVTEIGGEIRVDDGHYLHAVFSSTLFRFRDDLEALMEENHISLRSASRAGTSDLGVNRKRIDRLRERYLEHRD
jgi:uncharacterized protein (DUF1499 family)